MLPIKPAFFVLVLLNTFTFFGQSTNQPPTVTAVGDQVYCPQSQQKIVTSFNITDPDDTTTPAFFIQVSTGYVLGEDLLSLTGSHPTIVASWNASEARLTLTGKSGGAIYTDIIAAVFDVVFSSSNLTPVAKTFSLTTGTANFFENGHYYEFVADDLITWTDAKVAAENRNYFGIPGYLATLTSAGEAQIAGALTPGTGWIGGTDEETEGVWKWATGPEAGTVFWNGLANGSTPNYANWNINEPNNFNNSNEDYAHIKDDAVPGIAGSWNDLPHITTTQPIDFQAKGYVVEYGVGNPPLSISTTTNFSPPQILSTTPSVSCGNDPVNLSATSNTTDILWYNSQTGGTLLQTGDSYSPVLTSSTTFWVLASENGCTTGVRTAVTATLNPAPNVDNLTDVTSCDSYTLPALTNGNYFSATNGGGTPLNAGDVIATSTTLFVFSESATTPNCSDETSFVISINSTPIVDSPIDVTVCDSYTLPALNNGNYFSATNGGGTAYNTGDLITASTTLFVFSETATTPNCSDENSFVITINSTPVVDSPTDVSACDSYTLPALTNGNYFSATNGGGPHFNTGDVITASTTLFVFSESATTPNCSDETSFVITINSTPIVDNPTDVTVCDSYTLPALTNGNYFSATNGGGTAYNTGDLITASTTLFVFSETATTPNCSDENSFVITINSTPVVDSPTDVSACDSYTLPALTNGNYFSATNGGGTPLNAGDVITTSTTLFVFSESATTPNCSDENSFVITINSTPVVDIPTDVTVCDSYTLPALTNGNYFSATNGGGTAYNTGDLITASTTLFVFSETATTPNCSDENSFVITINSTPVVDSPTDVSACDSYTLPALTNGNYFSATNGGGPRFNAGDVITASTTLFVFSESATTPNCSDENSFVITVSTTSSASFIQIDPICEGDALTLPTTSIEGHIGFWSLVSDNIVSITYLFTPDDPCVNIATMTIVVIPTITPIFTQIDPICVGDVLQDLPTTSINGIEGVWTPDLDNTKPTEYTFDPTSSDPCILTTTMTIDVIPQTTPQFTQVDPICFGSPLDPLPIISNDGITGVWMPPINNSETTLYTFTPDRDQCAYPTTSTIVVNTIRTLTISATKLSEDFDANQIISVTAAGGSGTYEYKLDERPWQLSSMFENITGCDAHTVAVRDAIECSTIPSTTISILEYPKFFTPNGDGYNDTWTIKCLSDDPTAIVTIFDRFGKLLFEFKPSQSAWNGTLNGSKLPGTDYWFVVNYQKSIDLRVQFKPHFSLKY